MDELAKLEGEEVIVLPAFHRSAIDSCVHAPRHGGREGGRSLEDVLYELRGWLR